jgi:hypothetical protein
MMEAVKEGLIRAPLSFMPTSRHIPSTSTSGTWVIVSASSPQRVSPDRHWKVCSTCADAGDFTETNTCGKSVASGASCFIKVTFKPLMKGKRTADISIYDSGGGSPQRAMLIGIGT